MGQETHFILFQGRTFFFKATFIRLCASAEKEEEERGGGGGGVGQVRSRSDFKTGLNMI